MGREDTRRRGDLDADHPGGDEESDSRGGVNKRVDRESVMPKRGK